MKGAPVDDAKTRPFLYIAVVLTVSWVVQTLLFKGMLPGVPLIAYMFVPAVAAFLFFLAEKDTWRRQARLFTSPPGLKTFVFAVIYPLVWLSLAAVLALVLGVGKVNASFIPTLLGVPFLSGLLLNLVMILPSMFGEEYGWRGYLQPALTQRYSKAVATTIVAVVWAAWHIPSYFISYSSTNMGDPFLLTLLSMSVTAVAAFPYAYCFYLSGNIIPLVILHAVHDVTAQNVFFGSPAVPGFTEGTPALISIAYPAPLLMMLLAGLLFIPVFIKLYGRMDEKGAPTA